MFGKIVLILFGFLPQIFTEQCLTPNNETAQCTPLFSCPILIGALASQHPISIKFVSESNCGGTAINPMICCGTLANFTTVKELPKKNRIESKIKLLPTNRYCGYQHSDDYFRADNDTSSIRITEFPWAGRIKIRNRENNEIDYLCSASLINRRYVLTAAHCVNNKQRRIAEIIQLGEYNRNNKTDCVQEGQFKEECSEPTKEITVEKIVLHPQFNNRKHRHDIALIRLAQNVDYSDYIRPICLPFPERTVTKVGDTFLSTGWGTTGLDGTRVDIKKKVFSEMISQEVCNERYRKINFEVTNGQFCTIEFANNTVFGCQGDSGAPLMFSYRGQWQQEGILSFGDGCGSHATNTYTNVRKYLDWILESIEP